MRIRAMWRNCDFRNRSWNATPIDCYWVEASRKEAEGMVFPFLSEEAKGASIRYGTKGEALAEFLGDPPLPFCFLVAADLSTIDPMEATYPVANLWNDESPFEAVEEHTLTNLAELKDLKFG